MNGKTIPEKMDDFFCSGCTTFDYTGKTSHIQPDLAVVIVSDD